MSEQPLPDPNQQLNISDDGFVESSQIGGQAGRDMSVAQNQGSGNIFQGNTFNFFGKQKDVGKTELNRQEYKNRQILLNWVRDSWVKGVLETSPMPSSYTKVLIKLGLEERLDAVNHIGEKTWETSNQPKRTLPSGTRVINKFDEMADNRTLLILGEPGSGKTTTLLELARDLIDRAEADVNQPIPVVFNLSSWGSDKPNQSIDEWLVQELKHDYKVPKKFGYSWVKNQQLLFLLDGLDEVKGERRNLCVKALNQFIEQYTQTEIAITCRSQDYEALSYRLDLRKAVYLQSLTVEQINHYFDSVGSQAVGVKTLLQEDTMLRELVKSPLMLNMITLTYQGMPVTDLPRMNSLDEHRKYLFNNYINRMFSRRQSFLKNYTKEQSIHWLIWLSKTISQGTQTQFLIERMQPILLLSLKQKLAYRIIGNTFYYTILYILSLPFAFFILHNHIIIIAFYLYYMIFYLLTNSKILQPIKTIETLSFKPNITIINIKGWLVTLFKFYFFLLLGFGPFLGTFIILIHWLFGEETIFTFINFKPKIKSYFSKKFWIQLIEQLCFVCFTIVEPFFMVSWILMFGFFNRLFNKIFLSLRSSEIKITKFPNQGIKQSAINAGITGLIACLIYGVTAGLIAHTTASPKDSLIFGVTFGLAFGLNFGIVYGGRACIQHFTLRLILCCCGYMPWNYARFLDHATERIFLQKVGGGYIFIHRLLMEHFANMEQEDVQQLLNS